MADEIIDITPEEFVAQFGAIPEPTPSLQAAQPAVEPLEVVDVTPEEFAAMTQPQSKLGAFGRGVALGAGRTGAVVADVVDLVGGLMAGQGFGSGNTLPFRRTRTGEWQQAQEQAVGLPDYSQFEYPRVTKAVAEGLGGAAISAPFSPLASLPQAINLTSSIGGELGAEFAPDVGVSPVVGGLVGAMTPAVAAELPQLLVNATTRGGQRAAAGKIISDVLEPEGVAALQSIDPQSLQTSRTIGEAVPTQQAAMFEDAVRNMPEMGAPIRAVEQQTVEGLKKAAIAPIEGAEPLAADVGGLVARKGATAVRDALSDEAGKAWKALEKTGQQLDITQSFYSLADDIAKSEGVEGMGSARNILQNVAGKGNVKVYKTEDGRFIANLDSLQKLRSSAGEYASKMPGTSQARVLRRFVNKLDEILDSEATEMMGIAPENAEAYRNAISKTRDLKQKFKGSWIEDLADQSIDEKVVYRKLLQNKNNAEVYVKAFKDNPEMMAVARNAVAETVSKSTNPLKTWRSVRQSAKQVLSQEHYSDLEQAIKLAARRQQITERVKLSSPGQPTTAPRRTMMEYLNASLQNPAGGEKIATQAAVVGFVTSLVDPTLSATAFLTTGASMGGKALAIRNKKAISELLSLAAANPQLARELTKEASEETFKRLQSLAYTTKSAITPNLNKKGGKKEKAEIISLGTETAPKVSEPVKKAEIEAFSADNARLASLIDEQPPLVRAVIAQESDGKQSAISSKGARGLMQVMPIHGERLGLDLSDPIQNVQAGRLILREEMDRYKSLPLALAAYNAGSPEVNRAIRKAKSRSWVEVKKHLPQETRDYVPMVLARLKKLEKQG